MSNDGIFELNAGRLMLMMLPVRWRRPLMGALVMAGASSLNDVVLRLRQQRQQQRQAMCYSGQVCRLRCALNDTFDPELRRVAVMDAERAGLVESSRIFCRTQARPLMLAANGSGTAARLWRRGYGGSSGGEDFWVEVPAELADVATLQRVRALTDSYRLAGMRFGIRVTDGQQDTNI